MKRDGIFRHVAFTALCAAHLSKHCLFVLDGSSKVFTFKDMKRLLRDESWRYTKKYDGYVCPYCVIELKLRDEIP